MAGWWRTWREVPGFVCQCVNVLVRMAGRRSTGTEMSVSVRSDCKTGGLWKSRKSRESQTDRLSAEGLAGSAWTGRSMEDRQIASGSSWSPPGHRVCVDHDDRCLAVCRAVRNSVLDTVRYSPQCTRSVHNTNPSLSRVVGGMTCVSWDGQAFCQCRTDSRHPYDGESSSVCLRSAR